MTVIPLNEKQLEDVRAGIADREVHISFGTPENSWYEVIARPDETNTWSVKIRMHSQWMRRTGIPNDEIEKVLIETLGVALGLGVTLH